VSAAEREATEHPGWRQPRHGRYVELPMAEDCWDRAAQSYLDFWVPRLIPYYEDLVQKAGARAGERVLVPAVGPGGELIALASAMKGQGSIVATDASPVMIEHAKAAAKAAEIAVPITFEVADASDVLGEKWDLILSAFGLWQLEERTAALRSWCEALTDEGRVALLEWGPPDPTGPFELVDDSLRSLEPDAGEVTKLRELAAREPLGELLSDAGLRMVRHAVVRYRMEFGSAEGFFKALCAGCSYLQVCEDIGQDRTRRVADSFYARLSPPSMRTPLSFEPAASIAIAQRM